MVIGAYGFQCFLFKSGVAWEASWCIVAYCGEDSFGYGLVNRGYDMKYLRLIRGWVRLYVWGLCPLCNHDAPALYDCVVCEYYGKFGRYRGCQTSWQRDSVWESYRNLLDEK